MSSHKVIPLESLPGQSDNIYNTQSNDTTMMHQNTENSVIPIATVQTDTGDVAGNATY